ncbi:LysE family translocator [Nitratireductor pacificus]|uniref:Lysine exporter protein LysE/YggA n=1 Tax=Nitratireductor pacificus pht-3B TaxID=391937 RepID=K2MPP5_9HYPH|nr:LysE family transporter [Nitratireductor pacificus]EKF19297.1 lysine exporter protein LysE/YggA [Nitratireductor pacificus pht-3B]
MIAWSIFIPACFALNCAPGPNNMLAFGNAARLGLVPALLGGLGRLPAFVLLIVVTIVGLGAVLAASATAFTIIKMIGAIYLVYVGIQFWRKARALATTQALDKALGALLRRDFMIAISNPKAIAIFTAFFPQFIDASQPAWKQLTAMGGAFLLLEIAAVLIYVVAGAAVGRMLKSERVFVYLNRLVGGVLIASGGAMAFSRS